eukprot:2103082-Amphidinium_carterae.1
MIHKTKHFHDVSIITTGDHYDPNYVIEMIKFYYNTQQKEKQPIAHNNGLIVFMIEKKQTTWKKHRLRDQVQQQQQQQQQQQHNGFIDNKNDKINQKYDDTRSQNTDDEVQSALEGNNTNIYC